MVNNPSEDKKLLSEVIIALQKELIEQRQAVPKAIDIQNEHRIICGMDSHPKQHQNFVPMLDHLG